MPVLLGFHPHESVVVVGLLPGRRPGASEVGPVLRMDLPPPGRRGRAHAGDLARLLVARLSPLGITGMLIGIWTEQLWTPAARPPRDRLVRDVVAVVEAAGLEVPDAMYRGPVTYGSYLCRGGLCCPPGGAPVAELGSSAVAAAAVLAGEVVSTDREAVVAHLTPCSPRERAEVTASAAVLRSETSPARAAARAAALAAWRAAVAAGSTTSRSPAGWAELLVAFDDLVVRDAVMVMVAAGAGALPEAMVAAQEDAGARMADLWEHADADRDQKTRVVAVLGELTRRVDGRDAAPVWAVLAWVTWWGGGGVLTTLATERALAADPEYSLALLMDHIVTGAVPPPCWARRAARG